MANRRSNIKSTTVDGRPAVRRAPSRSIIVYLHRALAEKRRQDSDREERRRLEILARRRENIRAATEKYQRLNKHYHVKTDAGAQLVSTSLFYIFTC